MAGLTSSVARKAIKVGALPLGLPGYRRPGDVVILAYHRVGFGDREIDLPLHVFARQLAALKKRSRVRSLKDALSDQEGGVVLTFDDGYRDFHESVLPLLVANRVPALLYLASGLVAGKDHELAAQQLTWAMLREALATGLVAFGSHTHSHADLARASERDAEEEMRRSKELIEAELQVPCRHFAYPWGVGSPGAHRVARRLFDTAALHSWRTNRRGRIERHRLGRTPILRNDGTFFFLAKTLGLLDAEALAYRVLRRGPWRPL